LLAGYAADIFRTEAEAEHARSDLRGLESRSASQSVRAQLSVLTFCRRCSRVFSKANPRIELNLEIANTEESNGVCLMIQLISRCRKVTAHAHDLQAEVVAWDEIVAIAPPDHPLANAPKLTARTLCEYSFVAREVGSGTRAVTEAALQEQGIVLKPTMSLGSSEAVKRAVITGAGWALLSRLAIELELQTGALVIVPVEDLSIQRPLHRLRQRGKYESRAAREFVRMLRQSKS
jgi:DNA-binding transcriptional LysR family regulator